MKILEHRLEEQIRKAIQSLGVTDNQIPTIVLQITKPEFEGDLTLVCFPFTIFLGKGPEQIGQAIGEYLSKYSVDVEKFNVVKGFLNLSISNISWLGEFLEFTQSERVSGLSKVQQKVLIEYSSPNTNKPLHLGHLRNNFLGSALSELLKFAGYEVIKANLVNDRGIHICKSMVAYQETGNGETPESSGLKGDHLVGKYYVKYDQMFKGQMAEMLANGSNEEEAKINAPIALKAKQMLLDWEAGVPEVIELWKKMNAWVYAGFDETYKRLGVSFDKFYYESDTYILGKDIVDEGLANGIFYKKDDG